MERLVKGSVVVVKFPFSDFSSAKRRPALVLGELEDDFNDVILCQITSKVSKNIHSIELSQIDFKEGSLNKVSYVRPNKIFTVDKKLILSKVGTLEEEKLMEVIEKIIDILKNKDKTKQ